MRKKREKREKKIEKIKIKIRSYQLQTTIIFDRKLRLRRSTRPRQDNDEIYRVNAITVITIFGAKKPRLQAQKPIYSFFFVFLEII
jgi:hypothetical protein